MSIWANACALTFGLVAVLCIGQRYHNNAKRRSFPLPPGPPGLPWIGNIIGINANAPWLTYRTWAQTYGDLIYSRLLGRDIIIINSEKIARDLLEDRSTNYSDRPYLITNELCGIGFNSVMLPYGATWRYHRRIFHQTFRIDAVRRFLPLQHRRSFQLLLRLLHTPERLADHVFEYTTSVVLNSVYDYDPQSQNDEMVDIVAKVLEIVVPAVSPEVAVVVAAFPTCKCSTSLDEYTTFLNPALLSIEIPSWLPGMSFKRRMAVARGMTKQYIEKPFAHSLHKLRNVSPVPSMVHDALRDADVLNESMLDDSRMKDLKEAAATALLAASETSNSVLMAFFLMMVTNPEAQKNAQAQIDAVVGNARLPTIDDRSSLPYVDAILREVLRYSPPVPLSVPHASVDDDIYAGFHIPKGSIVMVNIWSIMHDESRYPDPYTFLPERFLNRRWIPQTQRV
ncbi:cytochrome P450 [Boletus edulis]|nr:cytochrome P450 [Boletus edulis]